nr:MAG TPA: hypothetical protein [Caudoviricetes sp.]
MNQHIPVVQLHPLTVNITVRCIPEYILRSRITLTLIIFWLPRKTLH